MSFSVIFAYSDLCIPIYGIKKLSIDKVKLNDMSLSSCVYTTLPFSWYVGVKYSALIHRQSLAQLVACQLRKTLPHSRSFSRQSLVKHGCLEVFVIVPSNNWTRETIRAMVFVSFATTDILNYSDLAPSSSTICSQTQDEHRNRHSEDRSPSRSIACLCAQSVSSAGCGPIVVTTANNLITYHLIVYRNYSLFS